jgi:hypothetical protein
LEGKRPSHRGCCCHQSLGKKVERESAAHYAPTYCSGAAQLSTTDENTAERPAIGMGREKRAGWIYLRMTVRANSPRFLVAPPSIATVFSKTIEYRLFASNLHFIPVAMGVYRSGSSGSPFSTFL